MPNKKLYIYNHIQFIYQKTTTTYLDNMLSLDLQYNLVDKRIWRRAVEQCKWHLLHIYQHSKHSNSCQNDTVRLFDNHYLLYIEVQG